MKTIKVIIADDAKINNDLMANALKEDNRIELLGIAEDGIQEYDLIKKYNPDLVITDNQMPNMNGIDVIKRIASEDLEVKPKFILVSGDSFGIFEKELNIIRTFEKPIDFDILKICIEDIFFRNDSEIEKAQIKTLELKNNQSMLVKILKISNKK